MFERSILIDNRSSKSWSFLASVSVELVALSLAILIPLTQTDHLPDFRWKAVSLGVPLQQSELPQIETTSSSARVSRFSAHRIFVPLLTRSVFSNAIKDTGSVSVEPPGFVSIEGAAPVGIQLDKFIEPHIVVSPPPPVIIESSAPSKPIRVSTGAQMAKLLRKVLPEYPPLAKTARVSGVVRLIGVIGKDGSIQNLQLISGHPLLAKAAIDAVKQWVYQPTLLNGEPVEVIAPIDVSFTLNQ